MNKIRIGQTAAAVLAVAAGSLTLGAAGTATAVPAATDICTGYGTNHRLDVADIKALKYPRTTVGYVELCQRWDDSRLIRWTNVRLGYTMNPGEHANGHVRNRHVDNLPVEAIMSTCYHGTGIIVAPDRLCSTGGVEWVEGWQDRADAYIYNVNNVAIAAGATDWTN
ncbi:hypothetical protein [Kribbella sp. CA-294648]|uniref:hypothetical protein n=1 Tax=Kribbella sp. CA-294648 TaxID=3239948 RepID=UPI003D8D8402